MFEISRKYGKTWLCVVLAAEPCLRAPGVRVVYGASTLKHLKEFVLPIMRKLEAEAPEDCRPRFNAADSHWVFPNGSWVHLFGADDMAAAEKGRGPEAVRAIFDEAGFPPSEVLKYVLSDVFKPSLMLTRGRPPPGIAAPWMILSSTPSAQPDHEFTRICEIAEANGHHFHRTIYDNPMLSPESIEQGIEEDAKENGMTVAEYKASSTFRREYLAERVVDKALVVMGDDWSGARESALAEVPRPEFFDGYVALDMGGVDPHAALFGFWDFKRGWLVIEDELLLRDGENTQQLADAIKAKEGQLWGSNKWEGTLRGAVELEDLPDWLKESKAKDSAPPQPYLRICDNDIQIAKDLQQLHRISFVPTAKDDKRWQVNEARILMREGRIKIHPTRCRNLDRHLRQTVWKNHRQSDYKRKNGEHGDLLDCLVYMVRNLRRQRNPYPANWGLDMANQWVRPAKPGGLKVALGLVKQR